VYLEGALTRTLRPAPVAPTTPPVTPTYDGPLPSSDPGPHEPAAEAVLNPFSVFRKGEPVLRRQLEALAAWHLVNIVRAYELSPAPADELNRMSAGDLIEVIIAGVRDGTAVRR
jgi:hypothetical protein